MRKISILIVSLMLMFGFIGCDNNTTTLIYNYSRNNIVFLDYGQSARGTFESRVTYSHDGISAPAQLQTLMRNNRNNVPLAGIFDADDFAVIFYLHRD